VAAGTGVGTEGLTATAAVCHDGGTPVIRPGRTSALEIHHVVEAAGIVAFGVLFYSYSFHWLGVLGTRWRRVLNGLAFGLVTVGLMIARMQLTEGVYIDARAVPLALIGLFEGWPAALMATGPPLIYRFWLGGAGAAAGMVGVVMFAALGALAHVWAERDGGVTPRHAFALTVGVYVATLLTFVAAGAHARQLFARVWLPMLATYVVGIGVAARLFHDVAEHMRLVEARARFRAIMDDASDAIRVVDSQTLRILDVNRADCEISGYSREELIGRDARDFWPTEPELRAKRQAIMSAARATGYARGYSQPYLTRAGMLIHVDSSRRIVEHQGKRYEIVIYRDAAQREAAEAVAREVEELRTVNLVARGAAHEINNPLAVIVGSLGLLERKLPDDGLERKWTDHALEAARRISDIVSRMTRITRVERAQTEHLPPILDIQKSSEPTRAEAP
jgi:PAS domain S-box-containing protein